MGNLQLPFTSPCLPDSAIGYPTTGYTSLRRRGEGSSCRRWCLPGRDLHSLCLAASAALGKQNKHRLISGCFPDYAKRKKPPEFPHPLLRVYRMYQLCLAWTVLCTGKHLVSLDQPRHSARGVKEKTEMIGNKKKLFWFADVFFCHSVRMLLFL